MGEKGREDHKKSKHKKCGAARVRSLRKKKPEELNRRKTNWERKRMDYIGRVPRNLYIINTPPPPLKISTQTERANETGTEREI